MDYSALFSFEGVFNKSRDFPSLCLIKQNSEMSFHFGAVTILLCSLISGAGRNGVCALPAVRLAVSPVGLSQWAQQLIPCLHGDLQALIAPWYWWEMQSLWQPPNLSRCWSGTIWKFLIPVLGDFLWADGDVLWFCLLLQIICQLIFVTKALACRLLWILDSGFW